MITNDYKWLITCGGAPDFKSGRISWIFRIRHSAGFYYKSGRILNKKDVKLFQVLFYVSQNTAESSPPGSSPRIHPPPRQNPAPPAESIPPVLPPNGSTSSCKTKYLPLTLSLSAVHNIQSRCIL